MALIVWQTDIWTIGDTDRRPRNMQDKDIQRDKHRIDRHIYSMTKSFKIDEWQIPRYLAVCHIRPSVCSICMLTTWKFYVSQITLPSLLSYPIVCLRKYLSLCCSSATLQTILSFNDWTFDLFRLTFKKTKDILNFDTLWAHHEIAQSKLVQFIITSFFFW